MQHPPARINILEKTQFGIPLRAWGILAVSALTAGAVFFGLLTPAGAVVSAALAVLIAGLGAALAFGEIDGQKPETWLIHYLAFRQRARYMVKGARPQAEPQVAFGPSGPEPKPVLARPLPVTRPAPGFWALSGTAVCVAVLVGLTLYLSGGGAQRLLQIAQSL